PRRGVWLCGFRAGRPSFLSCQWSVISYQLSVEAGVDELIGVSGGRRRNAAVARGEGTAEGVDFAAGRAQWGSRGRCALSARWFLSLRLKSGVWDAAGEYD